MGGGNSADEGEFDRAVLEGMDSYRIATTMCPVLSRECRNLWLDAAICQVRWYVDLDTVFLRMDIVFGIASSDQDASVRKKNGFAVIQAGCIPTTISVRLLSSEKLLTDGSRVQDREPLVTWFTGIVEDRVVVGVICETESGNTLC